MNGIIIRPDKNGSLVTAQRLKEAGFAISSALLTIEGECASIPIEKPRFRQSRKRGAKEQE